MPPIGRQDQLCQKCSHRGLSTGAQPVKTLMSCLLVSGGKNVQTGGMDFNTHAFGKQGCIVGDVGSKISGTN